MVNKELQAEEAVKRMEYFGIMPEVIDEFKQGRLLQSEYNLGIVYEVDPETRQAVEKFEREYNAVVYHVIKDRYAFSPGETMEMSSFLYVSDSEDEWDFDREDMKSGTPIAYVWNKTEPAFSEFGSIGVMPKNGGLCRNAEGFDFESYNRQFVEDEVYEYTKEPEL